MLTTAEQKECMRLVQSDDLEGLINLLGEEYFAKNLDFLSDGFSLLENVTSLEMMSVLLRCRAFVYRKNRAGKTPIHQIKRNLKSFLKEKRLERLKKEPDEIKLRALTKQIKNVTEAIRLFKLILFFDHHQGITVQKTGSFFNIFFSVVNARRVDNFVKDKTFFQNVAYILYDSWAGYSIKQAQLADNLLASAGYNEQRIYQNKRAILSSPILRTAFFMEDEMPKIFFHSSMRKEDPFYALSHFGTQKAAFDRLRDLQDRIDEKKGKFYEQVQRNRWKLYPKVYTSFLKMVRPLFIPDLGVHDKEEYRRLFLYYLLVKLKGEHYIHSFYELPSKDSFLFPSAVSEEMLINQKQKEFNRFISTIVFPKEYDFIFNDPLRMDHKEIKKELFLGKLYPLSKDKTDYKRKEKDATYLTYQRMVRFFYKEGYDGFVYKNINEDKGSLSYIIFHHNQVINASTTDIRPFYQNPFLNPHEKELVQLEERALASSREISLDAFMIECFKLYQFSKWKSPQKIRSQKHLPQCQKIKEMEC